MKNMHNEDYNRYCQIVGATDVGCKRSANEDFLGQEDTINGRIAVVCDGMGGHVGGATASHIAVDSILAYLREHYHEDPREAISEAISQANRAILSYAQMHPELSGMGSTCVLLIVRKGLVYIGHVGDSRIYLIRKRHIHQLTKDHSFVQMLVDSGQISKEQAEHHPRKNEITNALGIPNMQPATVREDAIQPEAGDVFLLCSDGLSGMVSDDEICKTASRLGELRAQERANRLIEQARENGGLDNITCELVEFSITPISERENKIRCWHKRAFWVYCLIILTLLIGGGVTWYLCKKSRDIPQKSPTEDNHNTVPQPEQPQPSPALIEREYVKYSLGDIQEAKKTEVLYVIVFEDLMTYIKTADEQNILQKLVMHFDPDSVLLPDNNKIGIMIEITDKETKRYIIAKDDLHKNDKVLFSICNDEKACWFEASVVSPKSTKRSRSITLDDIKKKNNAISNQQEDRHKKGDTHDSGLNNNSEQNDEIGEPEGEPIPLPNENTPAPSETESNPSGETENVNV